jgi:nicotinamide mononucleotide transporter
MSITSIWQQFTDNVIQTRWEEWLSTVLQIASVWYAKKNKVLVYPTGIIGVLLASYIYYFISDPPLYADAILNIYYFFMSIYGWYNWVQKKDEQLVFPISWCSSKELFFGVGIFIFFWGLIYYMLISITNSNTPVLDSLVSSTAVISMWWMAKRKMENWMAWIVSNIVAIPLNFYKGFMLFTLMYILFLGLAVSGFKEWKLKIKKPAPKPRG